MNLVNSMGKPSEVRKIEGKRVCSKCLKKLSIYNRNDMCFSCCEGDKEKDAKRIVNWTKERKDECN